MGGDTNSDGAGECVCPDLRCAPPGPGDSCLVASGQRKSVCPVHDRTASCCLVVRGSVPAWVAIAGDTGGVWVHALPGLFDGPPDPTEWTSRCRWSDRKSTRLNSSHLGISYA